MEEGKCKEKVWNKFYHHQCTKKVWKDGFCKIHHPESVKAREEKSNLRYKQKMDASVYGRLERALKKIEELETENTLLKVQLNEWFLFFSIPVDNAGFEVEDK